MSVCGAAGQTGIPMKTGIPPAGNWQVKSTCYPAALPGAPPCSFLLAINEKIHYLPKEFGTRHPQNSAVVKARRGSKWAIILVAERGKLNRLR